MKTIIENYAIIVINSGLLGYVTRIEKDLRIAEVYYKPFIKMSDSRVLKFSRDMAIEIVKKQTFTGWGKYKIVNHLGVQENI